MKVTEFCDLCEREWTERCGDVIGLSLTGRSASELAASVFASPEATASGVKGMPPGACGVRVNTATNVVTGSRVAVTHGAATDTATVRYEGSRRTWTTAVAVAGDDLDDA